MQLIGSWQPGRFSVSGIRYSVFGIRYSVFGTAYRVLRTAYRVPHTAYRVPHTAYTSSPNSILLRVLDVLNNKSYLYRIINNLNHGKNRSY